MSVKWREKKRVTQKFNVEKLKENTNLQNYIETIDKNLKNDNTELDQLWEKLEKTIKQAAKDVLGFLRREENLKNGSMTDVEELLKNEMLPEWF